MENLEEIVRTDEKQRYSFNEDFTLIRANQGHSIPVDVELEEKTPPDILWHGTGEKYVSSIDVQGCGRPVDDPAKQEHRPSRETRPESQRTALCPSFLGCGNGEKGRKQAWETGDL